MRVLVTGSEGFIGKNLISKLSERNDVEIISFNRNNTVEELTSKLDKIDFVFHLAGVNRASGKDEFQLGNVCLSEILVKAIMACERKPRVLFASSSQASLDNDYGRSKMDAEMAFGKAVSEGLNVEIIRLPNVFGKWCKPNYNSVVATFCHNVAIGKPIEIHNEQTVLDLIYIDDVISGFLDILDQTATTKFLIDAQVYKKTIKEVAELLYRFKDIKNSLGIGQVGTGFERALYSTFLTYLPIDDFSYLIPKHSDSRGDFVEMLKTSSSGQFSYFTAHPGVIRGGHYHHSKTEKFLVLSGSARFRFRHIISEEYLEIFTEGGEPRVVETIPGWAHDITNIGEDNLIVMLWANEIFDPAQTDTVERLI